MARGSLTVDQLAAASSPRSVSVTLSAAEQVAVLRALGLYEMLLLDARDRGSLPASHAINRVARKLRHARYAAGGEARDA